MDARPGKSRLTYLVKVAPYTHFRLSAWNAQLVDAAPRVAGPLDFAAVAKRTCEAKNKQFSAQTFRLFTLVLLNIATAC